MDWFRFLNTIYTLNIGTLKPCTILGRKFSISPFYYLLMCLNTVDQDQMLHSAASDLGPQCLLKYVCPNTDGKYGIQ